MKRGVEYGRGEYPPQSLETGLIEGGRRGAVEVTLVDALAAGEVVLDKL